ncbi:MAG: sigma-70 family RNA polymerase sigma factor [Kiritimatiellae bacterium]|nr:sigma-70 family RNA polymerase sigma factor [Kiritimatiellia bacterium]
MKTPTTSTTLLRALGDTQSARWGDFVERYEPSMRAFMAASSPSAPADDIIQETLIALVAAMPSYVYSPNEKGHFRNYLLGILRNKALRHLRDREREESALREFSAIAQATSQADDADEVAFRESVYELALAELLADPAIRPQTKQIFRRVAINGESPEAVAAAFGVTRNSVDQTKARMVAKLRQIKERLVASR